MKPAWCASVLHVVRAASSPRWMSDGALPSPEKFSVTSAPRLVLTSICVSACAHSQSLGPGFNEEQLRKGTQRSFDPSCTLSVNQSPIPFGTNDGDDDVPPCPEVDARLPAQGMQKQPEKRSCADRNSGSGGTGGFPCPVSFCRPSY